MRFLVILTAILLLSCSGLEKEIKLYNGYSFEGWHIDVPAMDTSDVESPFIPLEGSIKTKGVPGGHLITDQKYSDYRLEIEYKFLDAPGNCGVLVHASKPRVLYDMFPKSIEAQMMHNNAGDFWVIGEDIVTENMLDRRGPKEEWGVVEGTKRRIKNLTDDSENELGEWNKMVIECFQREIKVWLNGDLVNHGFDCTVSSGQIALQSEGVPVEFKNIILKPIKALSHE